MSKVSRGDLNKSALAAGALATLPISLIKFAYAEEEKSFTFASKPELDHGA